MQSDKRPQLLTAAAGAALGGLALWLALRFLVPWTLPFLIALALSALLEGPVGFLSARLSLPRWAAAAGCTLLLVLLLSGALLLALWRLWYEASLLLEGLPRPLAPLPPPGGVPGVQGVWGGRSPPPARPRAGPPAPGATGPGRRPRRPGRGAGGSPAPGFG